MPHQIHTIDQQPAHVLVTEQLQRAILLGRYLPGDKLPAERLMAEQFGVSRSSVRDAIKILVENGLLQIKLGTAGGAIVQDMGNAGVRQRMKSVARANIKDYRKLLEFRFVVECAAAELAAANRTKGDLRTLRKNVDRMDSLFEQSEKERDGQFAIRFYAEDTEFHIGIARAARNQYLFEIVEDVRYKMFLPLGELAVELDSHANDKHHELYRMIEAGDSAGAGACMREHIQGSFKSLFGD